VQIFRTYIAIELTLAEVDRCRLLYEKYLEWAPSSCYAWTKYAELEKTLNEFDRARAVFELAIAQAVLDTPELLWKAYIDFEIAEGEYQRTRDLYERLLNRTKHVKVGATAKCCVCLSVLNVALCLSLTFRLVTQIQHFDYSFEEFSSAWRVEVAE
jgi:tetratricopeptide (TPR) repeat protein